MSHTKSIFLVYNKIREKLFMENGVTTVMGPGPVIASNTADTQSEQTWQLVQAHPIYGVIALAIMVCIVVAWWMIFKKAGRKGIAAVVPVWNTWTLFEISGMKGWYALIDIAVSALSYYADKLVQTPTELVLALVALALCIWILVLRIMRTFKLVKKFDQSTWFAIGMLFLEPIFVLVLGFGDAKYDKKA